MKKGTRVNTPYGIGKVEFYYRHDNSVDVKYPGQTWVVKLPISEVIII